MQIVASQSVFRFMDRYDCGLGGCFCSPDKGTQEGCLFMDFAVLSLIWHFYPLKNKRAASPRKLAIAAVLRTWWVALAECPLQ